MNFIKKKLKAVQNKTKHEDDDDYDNYIPPVPPHPSTLIADQSQQTPVTANNTNSASNGDTQAIQDDISADELLEQLRAKEFQRKQEEKEKIKINEESKRDREDWKFFLNLTAKVDDITSRTQTVLEKLKDSSAIDHIVNKLDDHYADDKYDESAPKPAGNWIDFCEDRTEQILDDENFVNSDSVDQQIVVSESEPTHQISEGLPKISEEPINNSDSVIASKLLDDFGFNEEPEVIPVAYQPVVFEEEDYLGDPFDTSFVNVSHVDPAAAADVILNTDSNHAAKKAIDDSEPDPFDTSYVESALTGQSVVKPDYIDISPIVKPLDTYTPTAQTPHDYCARLSRTSSRDSIMSNPFLTDLTDSYTPYASGVHTPYSGTATPKRRNSTNPFEESPEEEDKPELNVCGSASYGCVQSPVASAIADMTADFYNTISSKSYNDPLTPPSPPSSAPQYAPKSVSRTTPQPFDPFATIHDDDTPKRQSLGDTDSSANVTSKVLSPDANDPFSGTDSWRQLNNESSYLPTYDEHINYYMLDMSDNEHNIVNHNSSSDINGINSTETARRSSAFQMELLAGDLDEPPPTFEPLPATQILQRKQSVPLEPPEQLIEISHSYHDEDLLGSNNINISNNNYFDPFTTVFDKDAEEDEEDVEQVMSHVTYTVTEPEPELNLISDDFETFESSDNAGSLHHQDSISDADVGQPNKNATGIINDAFDETIIDCSTETHDYLPSISGDEYYAIDGDISGSKEDDGDDTTRSETNAIHDGSATTTTANIRTTSDSGVAVGSNLDDMTDCGKDPFDTSEFDSAAFDAFATKFDQTSATADNSSSYDPFASPMKSINKKQDDFDSEGFDIFDPFGRSSLKTPKNTPSKLSKNTDKDSFDDEESDNLKIVIKAKMRDTCDTNTVTLAPPPLLPPPPKSPVTSALEDLDLMPEEDQAVDEFEAFFGGGRLSEAAQAVQPVGGEPDWPTAFGDSATKFTDSAESPQTPLYDEDTSQPLEPFPAKYTGDGWDMMLRHPNKKKLTANRFWKKIYVKFLTDTCVFQLFNKKEDNNPFQETPLQASYSLSDISAQQYDQYGKIFTIKLQYIFYRERVGVRPGQIAKVMQGQFTSMGQIAKLGMPLEHAPQVSELLKLGSLNYNDLKQLQQVVEESLFRLSIHRDRALQYKTEEIQCTVQDELYVEQNRMGTITKQLARVRIFFLAFVNGMPTIEVGINDLTRQGKEVVGRHDIIPVVTEEWIRLEGCDFHCVVQQEDFESTRIIKLIPPDACHFELMRFRIRPPRNRELPLQVNAHMNITKCRVELKCEVLVPGCISRKHGQIPCEDIMIRFHIPECWIYFFRVEKHFRYGALKSAHRRTGKIKGIERLLGSQNNDQQLIEVTAGQAKYEHAFHSVVWRIPRLPKEGQGAYTQQILILRLPFTSFDQIPETFYEFVHVEFKMPSTTVSHTTLRSISVSNENPPEKYVRYLAKYEYKVEMSVTFDEKTELEYVSAAGVAAGANTAPQPVVPSDGDSNVNSNDHNNESDDSN